LYLMSLLDYRRTKGNVKEFHAISRDVLG